MSSSTKRTEQVEARTIEDQNGQISALMQVMQSAAMPAVTERGASPAAIPEGSRGRFFGLIKNAETRRHDEMMEFTRNIGAETALAVSISAAISTDYFANAMDSEAAMGDIILQYRNSPMAMAAAPIYAQCAREILTRDMTATAQAGSARIRRKIESR